MEIPSWAKDFLIKTSTLRVDGVLYEYAILRREMEPNIPGFVGFPEGKYLIISEDVPVLYRRHYLSHEIRELVQMAGRPGRCLTALKRELDEIPTGIRDAYISYRLEFYNALLRYYQEHLVGNEELVKELTASYEHLRKLVLG